MSGALALKYDQESYEIINGETYMMSRPNTNHMKIELNIATLFKNYLKGKKCEPFNESDVFLSDDTNIVPDVMIVCDPEKIEEDGIHGAPDLVVEILSPSTEKRDKIDKLRLYEKHGVKEYWIVDPKNFSVDVYLLQEGKFIRDNTYKYFTDEIYQSLSERDKADVFSEIKVSLYDDFFVNVADIFERVK